MIVGDLNSRTGVLNDLLIPDKNEIIDESDSKFLDIINIFNSLNVPLNRTNMDTKVNNNGRSLIEMCNVHDLCIVNGRFGSDKNIGNTTCADVSTIDYAICTPDLFPKITDFTIDTFCDSLSDIHKPIIVNVNITRNQMHANNPIITNNINTKETYVKCKWEECKKEEYEVNFDMNKIKDIIQTLSNINTNEITQDKMDNINSDLNNIFMEPAKTTGMYKKLNTSIKNRKSKANKPWFNEHCKK